MPTLRVPARREIRRLLSLTSEVITCCGYVSVDRANGIVENRRFERDINENSASITSERRIGQDGQYKVGIGERSQGPVYEAMKL